MEKPITLTVLSTDTRAEIKDTITAGDSDAYPLSITFSDLTAITGTVRFRFVRGDDYWDRDATVAGNVASLMLEPDFYAATGTELWVSFEDSNLYTPLHVYFRDIRVPSGNVEASTSQPYPAWAADMRELDFASHLAENAEDGFNLEMISHKYRRPMITIVDDDGRTEVYTKLKAIVETHGIPITSAIITSRIDSDSGTMTLAQMNELKTLGFEFISHTHNHVDLSTLSESAIVSELSQSRNWLLNNGFDSGKEGVVYPFGGKNAIVTKLTRRYYRCGIGIDNVNAYINYPPLKTYELERVDLDKGVAVVSGKIDDAVANNGWIIIMSHSAYPGFSEANLNAIIDYAKTKSIEFVTIKEGLNKIGNIVDILSEDGTNAIIDVDGETYGRLSGYNYIKSDNISANTPITDYKINTTSVTYIPSHHPNIAGFPDGAGGMLETHRHLNDAFNYQEYVVRNQDVRFFRRWDSSAWTPWQRTNSLVKGIATDTILASTLLNTMSTENQKNITIQKVNTATGFPEGKPGILITQPLCGTGLAYQMYHIASSTKIYKRFWTGTEWSAWTRLDLQSALKHVTLNHGTLSAGTSIDFEVGSGAFVFGDNVVSTPKTALPAGILWNSWIVSNGVAKIRLANITTNPIVVGSVDWLMKTLSNAN